MLHQSHDTVLHMVRIALWLVNFKPCSGVQDRTLAAGQAFHNPGMAKTQGIMQNLQNGPIY